MCVCACVCVCVCVRVCVCVCAQHLAHLQNNPHPKTNSLALSLSPLLCSLKTECVLFLYTRGMHALPTPGPHLITCGWTDGRDGRVLANTHTHTHTHTHTQRIPEERAKVAHRPPPQHLPTALTVCVCVCVCVRARARVCVF